MIQVRATTHKGAVGWAVRGHPDPAQGGWPLSIFTTTEAGARAIQAAYKADPERGPLVTSAILGAGL